MIWHKATGVIRYDPDRNNMKRRVRWWCVINTDADLARYYRYWIDRQRNPLGFEKQNLCVPAWGAHVSVVRGEEPQGDFKRLWKAREGQRVTFEYQNDVYQTGQDPNKPFVDHYWCVRVRCQAAMDIRAELGLPEFRSFHMTIGRTY